MRKISLVEQKLFTTVITTGSKQNPTEVLLS